MSLSRPLKDKTVTWGIGASLGIGVAAYLLPQLMVGFAIAIYAQLSDRSIDDIFSGDNFVLSFVFAIATSALGFLVLLSYVQRKNVWKKLGYRPASKDDLLLVVPAYAVYFFAILAINIAISVLLPEVNLDQAQDSGFNGATGFDMVLAFITLVLIAPFFEETLFRGFMFRGIARVTSFWPAALTTSILFGLAHGQLNVALDTFVLGMAAAWLVWQTKSIWPAILLHMLKNFVAYLFIFVFDIGI